MSPVYLIPPSAITGIPDPEIALETSITAESWGNPTPAITLVVQIDPGPIPTLTASAPASTKYFAASPVAIFPTITSRLGNFFFIFFNKSTTPLVWPWAVSIIIASTSEATKAFVLLIASTVTPIAAATLSLPYLSLLELGFKVNLVISLKVINPISL